MRWLVIAAVAAVFGCHTGPLIRTEKGELLPLASQDLAARPAIEVADRIRSDAVALKAISEGLLRLEAHARTLQAELDRRPGQYTQAENDLIRQLMLSYLNYRTALFRMVAFHSSYETIPDEGQRWRSYAVYYTAGITLFARGLAVAQMMDDSPNARRKLNEPEPVWGIPADVFDTVYDNVSHAENVDLLRRSMARHRTHAVALDAARAFAAPEFEWMPAYLEAQQKGIVALLPSVADADRVRLERDAKAFGHSVWYAIQAFFADLAGDTRVWPAKAAIGRGTVRDLADELQPGDIILARKNFYISNGFLPGFWPHAILYVGSPEELEARGLDRRPWVARHLERYKGKASDGNAFRVIEAISEGVVFSSLEQVMHADFVAVLRPRVSEARKDLAIDRAFAHLGKPYDFDFDFFSTDTLVCTELVYRAYDEDLEGERLELEMQRILGRDTYPAIEFVRKFADEWTADVDRAEEGLPPQRQLDFVAYIDGDTRGSMAAFMDTADRPSTPERAGFTAGLSAGYRFSGAGLWPLDDTLHDGTVTLRAGHSLTWRLLLQYEASLNLDLIEGVDRFRLGHMATLQWHPTRLLIFGFGAGVHHRLEDDDPLAWGPLTGVSVGYELLQGYSWALDLRGYYQLGFDPGFGDPRAATGLTFGIQFY